MIFTCLTLSLTASRSLVLTRFLNLDHAGQKKPFLLPNTAAESVHERTRLQNA
jgi:hypothetical protein